ncbi:hypothetical protein ACQPW1_19745 [Nocardia sp. CA-128927]|uniref:hypothetical protein n=1 Tax=Nocardia sp. CA-128927 TaxID=3239975 RepID=UPI003D990BC5
MVETIDVRRRPPGDGTNQREQLRRKDFRQRPPATPIDMQPVALAPRHRSDISFIDGNTDPRSAQPLRETKTAETRTDNNDVRRET